MRKSVLLLSIALLGLLASCRRDPMPGQGGGGGVPTGATPYMLNLPKGFSTLPQTSPADNPLTVEGVYLGRMLFYEPMLSGNDAQSCASCHHQENAFTDPRRFSLGIDGIPGKRNAMPIFNLGWGSKFFWDGGAKNLESQVTGPIVNPLEMHEDLTVMLSQLRNNPVYPPLFKAAFGTDSIVTMHVQKALAQFMRSIVSGNSKFDNYRATLSGLNASEMRGLLLFTTSSGPEGGADCFHCHSLGSFVTDNDFHNNGLDDAFPPGRDRGLAEVTGRPSDIGKFKTPSLKNLKYTAPYMHDGRFNTLAEVIDFYDAGVRENSPNLDPFMDISHRIFPTLDLSPQEKQDLINFLNTMNDSVLVTNPAYSKP